MAERAGSGTDAASRALRAAERKNAELGGSAGASGPLLTCPGSNLPPPRPPLPLGWLACGGLLLP